MTRFPDEAPAKELLVDLVAIDSINPVYGGNGEGELLAYLQRRLSDRRIPFEVQQVYPGRSNLVARVGPLGAPAILLEAHMDTVGVEGWREGSPFELREEDGRFFGRGSCDTKASLAVFLHTLEAFVGEPDSMKRALVFAATVDEESEQLGAYELAKILPRYGVKWAISGEPTRSDVVSRHKGVGRYLLEARGRAAHAATPELGENAIYKAARLCRELEALGRRLESASGKCEMERGTLNVGVVKGGIGFNIVPDHCQLDVDRRFGSKEAPERARAEIEAICEREGDVSLEVFLERPALTGKGSAAFVHAMQAAAYGAGYRMQEREVPYMTNAVAYEEQGIAAVVFGPGDIAQAHKVDEYVEAGQMLQSLRILERLFTESKASIEQTFSQVG